MRPYDGVPEFFISIPGAEFIPNPNWYFNFEYPVERQRGLDFHEDLFAYGTFRLRLEAGQHVGIIISTRNPAGRDAFELHDQERERRQNLLHFLPNRDDFPVMLTLAADQFLVQRSENLRTIGHNMKGIRCHGMAAITRGRSGLGCWGLLLQH